MCINNIATADAVANTLSERLRELREEEKSARGERLAIIQQDIEALEDAIMEIDCPI